MPDFASSVLASILLMAAAGAATPSDDVPRTNAQLAQVTIEQHVIIRIPILRPPEPPRGQSRASLSAPLPPNPPQAPDLREVKGPKCIKVEKLRGYVLDSDTGITLLTDKDEGLRAHFGKTCRAADFWSGFYIEPNKDGAICAGRDAVHARNGSNCDVEKFTKLVPEKPEKVRK